MPWVQRHPSNFEMRKAYGTGGPANHNCARNDCHGFFVDVVDSDDVDGEFNRVRKMNGSAMGHVDWNAAWDDMINNFELLKMEKAVQRRDLQ